jgi:hypothetical protein
MNQAQFTVSTTPVKIFTGPGKCVVTPTSGNALYFGDSSVSASDGAYSPHIAGVVLDVCTDAELYVVAGSGSHDVRVLSWY